jgi:DNA-binding cell septation regulator SpoVG
MPRTKRANGKYIDLVAPLNNETRQMLEEKVLAAYRLIVDEPVVGRSRG